METDARGSELRWSTCLAWALSSAAVAAWADGALGLSVRASAIFVTAEASSSAMEASTPSAILTSAWRRWWCSSSASFVARRSAVFSISRKLAFTVSKEMRASLIRTSAGISAQKGAKCCMWRGGGWAVAMGEVGRCPRKPPGPGPDTARMASVAIGDVAAESRMEGARGDPELVGAGA